MIGAIETEYKGYRFRSRLEARWAVFFDTLGIEWKYETEGYQIGEHRYLPDFWLPGSKAWVEVKGDRDGLRKQFDRMRAVLGPSSPLPGFANGDSELIILGDVPENAPGTTILHPSLGRRSGILERTWGFFCPMRNGQAQFVSDAKQSYLYLLFGKFLWTDLDTPDSKGWDVDAWTLDTPGNFRPSADAYRAARQARFEHGADGR